MIFYYSATNNSKYVAQKLAKRQRDTIVSITEFTTKGYVFNMEYEQRIGFVIPTYFYGIPNLVNVFLKNLEMTEVQGKYVYLVLTCGMNTANAASIFRRQLKKKGYHLDAIYSVKMVDTYVPFHPIPLKDEIKYILRNEDLEIDNINDKVCLKQKGDFNIYKGIAPKLMSQILYPFYKYGRNTKKFRVTQKCSGCGKCQKNCPVKAIQINGGKPKWEKKRCELCLKCLHCCPTQAIEYGKKTVGKGRYIHGD